MDINVDLIIRISAFVGIFAVMAAWEMMAPRRPWQTAKARRWVINLALVGFNTLFTRALLASGALGAAVLAGQGEVGLFHHLDLALVGRSHHCRRRVGSGGVFSTCTHACRAHPLAIAYGASFRYGFRCNHRRAVSPDRNCLVDVHQNRAIILIGASPMAVLMFEVLLNATAMFNHSNVCISVPVDRMLRWFVVTPDMHRIHHSIIPRETNSNFGFNLPWWDRALGTYLSHPCKGHEHMTIGLEQYRDYLVRPRGLTVCRGARKISNVA